MTKSSLQAQRLQSLVVGIDLGGTVSRFVSLTAGRNILASHKVLTPFDRSSVSHLKFFGEQIAQVGFQFQSLVAIGIGASGPIDSRGIIQNPDTFSGFTGCDWVKLLEAVFEAPCFIENDAVTATVAEVNVGAAQGAESLLYGTLGTGVGVWLLIDDKPFRGRDGVQPEDGNISVSGSPAPCYGGRHTCWEQKA